MTVTLLIIALIVSLTANVFFYLRLKEVYYTEIIPRLGDDAIRRDKSEKDAN
jgi:hypothetical protein